MSESDIRVRSMYRLSQRAALGAHRGLKDIRRNDIQSSLLMREQIPQILNQLIEVFSD
jgi:hypothetical protein